jgi:hypothetical protein
MNTTGKGPRGLFAAPLAAPDFFFRISSNPATDLVLEQTLALALALARVTQGAQVSSHSG